LFLVVFVSSVFLNMRRRVRSHNKLVLEGFAELAEEGLTDSSTTESGQLSSPFPRIRLFTEQERPASMRELREAPESSARDLSPPNSVPRRKTSPPKVLEALVIREKDGRDKYNKKQDKDKEKKKKKKKRATSEQMNALPDMRQEETINGNKNEPEEPRTISPRNSKTRKASEEEVLAAAAILELDFQAKCRPPKSALGKFLLERHQLKCVT